MSEATCPTTMSMMDWPPGPVRCDWLTGWPLALVTFTSTREPLSPPSAALPPNAPRDELDGAATELTLAAFIASSRGSPHRFVAAAVNTNSRPCTNPATRLLGELPVYPPAACPMSPPNGPDAESWL